MYPCCLSNLNWIGGILCLPELLLGTGSDGSLDYFSLGSGSLDLESLGGDSLGTVSLMVVESGLGFDLCLSYFYP